ncbi:MAG: DUF3102 domain-containing protein [Planctomycetaceae bacterium]|nr:DUF3102 domain-containing protein [Planctomycetaceae bacterium]
MAKVIFQYDVIADKALRKRAELGAKEIKALIQRTGEAVIEIGRRLTEIRESMPAPVFRAWYEVEFCWNQPTVSNYMQAARVFGDLDCLERFQPSAIVALARKNVPQKVIDEAVGLARGGETVTLSRVKLLLEQAGVQSTNPSAGKHRKPERAAAALAVATVRADSAESLRQTLDSFVANLDQLAAGLTPDDRNAIADRFLQLAMQLKGLDRTANEKPTRKPSVSKTPARVAS